MLENMSRPVYHYPVESVQPECMKEEKLRFSWTFFERFNCSLELTVNLIIEKVLHSKHCFASLSQNFLSYCNALCINLEQAGLM